MVLHVYVDGSGKPKSTYGYYVKETGVAKHFKGRNLTNNQAECLAILEVLQDPLLQKADSLVIYSNSQNTVRQLNQDYLYERHYENGKQIRKIIGNIKDIDPKGVVA